jgi:hypothetical protein
MTQPPDDPPQDQALTDAIDDPPLPDEENDTS